MSDFPILPVPGRVSPYLHTTAERFYNPLTDGALAVGDPLFAALRSFQEGGSAAPEELVALAGGGWLITDPEKASQSFP